MDSVISITREKTAIIFPNAIGLQTKNDKVNAKRPKEMLLKNYVFSDTISR